MATPLDNKENTMPPLELFPAKGTYTLIMSLSKETCLSIGKLGLQRLPRGYYTYTGSAMGTGASSLNHRVSRHQRREKKRFWHIDFLLAHRNATLTGVVAAQTSRNMECEMNRCIKGMGGEKIPVPGFGASDCKKNCESHLIYFNEDIKSKIIMLYTKKLGFNALSCVL